MGEEIDKEKIKPSLQPTVNSLRVYCGHGCSNRAKDQYLVWSSPVVCTARAFVPFCPAVIHYVFFVLRMKIIQPNDYWV